MKKLSDHLSTDQLISDFKESVTDVEELLKETASLGGEKLAEIRTKAAQSLSTAKARLENSQSNTITGVKLAAKTANYYIHDNPWWFIGIAAGVGVGVGLYFRRR